MFAYTVGERYGRFQNTECVALKESLLRLEETGATGRVHLSDSYHSSLRGGNWKLGENVAYLRQLGALDDTGHSSLKVIIPDYLSGPSNHIAASSFYAVCCIDECADFLDHLETKVGVSDHPSRD